MATTILTDVPLLRALAWTSAAFPTGAFAYSHGLERAVEDGAVRDRSALLAYVAAVLRHGAGRTDAILLARAWREGPDAELVLLAARLRGTGELAAEQAALGDATLRTIRAVWPSAGVERLAAVARALEVDAPPPIVLGVAGRDHGVALDLLVTAMLHALATSLVSAGLRLIPLGQTDGQRVLAALEPLIAELASAALTADPDDLGGCALAIDLLSARHETQYTRLFRS